MKYCPKDSARRRLLIFDLANHQLLRTISTKKRPAPGYHETQAVKRVLQKKAETSGTTYEQVQENLEKAIPTGRMGNPKEFGSLAAWLLSPHSGYITGQTISVDGGIMAGSFG